MNVKPLTYTVSKGVDAITPINCLLFVSLTFWTLVGIAAAMWWFGTGCDRGFVPKPGVLITRACGEKR